MQDFLVAREQEIFAQEKIAVTQFPGGPVGLFAEIQILRGHFMGKLTHLRQVVRIACGQHRQRIDRAGPILPQRLPFKRLAGGLEDAFGLGAVPGGCLAVGAEHRKFEFHILGFSRTGNRELQHPAVRLLFRLLNGPGDALAGVVVEELAACPKNDVINLHHSIGGRFRADMGHKYLTTGQRGAALQAVEIIGRPGVDPSAQAGCTEVVGLLAVHRAGVLREVRGGLGRFLGQGAVGQEQQ